MPSRTVVWTLAILAIVLVVVPLLGMMACCGGGMMGMGGMMRGGGNTLGMTAVGIVWMPAAVAVGRAYCRACSRRHQGLSQRCNAVRVSASSR